MVIRYTPAKDTGSPVISNAPTRALYANYNDNDAAVSGWGQSFRVAVAAVLRRKARIFLCALVPFVATFCYNQTRPSIYVTTATIAFDAEAQRTGQLGAEADVLPLARKLGTSRALMQKVMDKERLADDPVMESSRTTSTSFWRSLLTLGGLGTLGGEESKANGTLRIMADSLQFRRGEAGNLVDLEVRSVDAVMAARLANAMAAGLVAEVASTAESSLSSDRSRNKKRLEDLQTRLRDAEERLARYRSSNGYEGGGATTGVDAVAQARTVSAETRNKADQIQKLLASGKDVAEIAELIRSPTIDKLRTQLGDAINQEQSYRNSLGLKHPSTVEAQQLVRDKKRMLAEALRLTASAAKADAQAAREQEVAAERRSANDPQPVRPAQPTLQMREMEREVETARAALETFNKTADSAEGASPTKAARVLIPAAVPTESVSTANSGLWKIAAIIAVALALLIAGKGIADDLTNPGTVSKLAEKAAAKNKPSTGQLTDPVPSPLRHVPPNAMAAAASQAEGVQWSELLKARFQAHLDARKDLSGKDDATVKPTVTSDPALAPTSHEGRSSDEKGRAAADDADAIEGDSRGAQEVPQPATIVTAAENKTPSARLETPAAAHKKVVSDPVFAPPKIANILESIAHELATQSGDFAIQTVFLSATTPDRAKSEVAIDLARALRRLAMRVLIIDANEPNPRLSHTFGGGTDIGFIDIQGRERRMVALDPIPDPCLALIPIEGPHTPQGKAHMPIGPSGLLGNYDVVIMEGPSFSGSPLDRKLAQAAQAIILATAPDSPPGAVLRISQLLGVNPAIVRAIPVPAFSLTPPPVQEPERPLQRMRRSA